ncbi:LysR family transcriptional regulator [Erwinia amylovora]|uniref:LysR family transcriptional regulator n=1 Tax=Erwinia amylovora TaxID=552 RepID=UPI000C089B15|nr:LysR family transcriptional regulator [Erwinia amylovora]MBZ2398286.1 LysR family transcriptional regulator [Erwinia amylovora]MBZ2401716.1 LysR family transcriptional regulator [Erwinia amylovora]UDJ86673.1 LysR family transcriptional regulator [Erwinia amylovora]UDJ98129.1 LysR family transcriptional regulator [Erwinia amylovora]UDK89809.1 LysR family transcriptional regulator [Erwinia amylovora]
MDPFSRFSHYFAAVATSGSLRKAAEQLHVSASAINRQILLAEEMMGAPLFERLPAGLKMTTAGEMLYDDIRRWNREFRRTRQRFDELQGLKRGHVSVALIAALNEGVVVDALAGVARTYPWLTFDLAVHDSQTVVGRVASAEVDFGLLLDPVAHSGLEVRAFCEMPIGVAMPADHPLAQQPSLSFGQISENRHIMPTAPLMVHERTAMLYARHGITPQATICCNDIRLITSLVCAGSGLAVLSLLDVRQEVASGELAFVPLQGQAVRPLTLALCVAPKRQLSRAAQVVIQHLSQVLESLAEEQG